MRLIVLNRAPEWLAVPTWARARWYPYSDIIIRNSGRQGIVLNCVLIVPLRPIATPFPWPTGSLSVYFIFRINIQFSAAQLRSVSNPDRDNIPYFTVSFYYGSIHSMFTSIIWLHAEWRRKGWAGNAIAKSPALFRC